MTDGTLPDPDPWPVDGLEFLGCCPLCSCASRSVLHRDLRDSLFQAASGSWTLHRCHGCGLAYLDPRPSVSSIGLAYARYYTHEQRVDDDPCELGERFTTRWKQRVLRDYLSVRHGGVRGPWRGLLAPLMRLRPEVKRSFDLFMRGLPRPWPGATVLDVGCGNGRFLAWARSVGWTGTGTDTDPAALREAHQRGLDVRNCELRDLEERGRRFDAITISHVIEHVHDPRSLLRDACRLLKPEGYFWIQTPNVDSWGHRIFGRHWRGLEPPRHLQLFHPGLLVSLLEEAGFVGIKNAEWQADWSPIASASMALAREAGAAMSVDAGPDPERIGRDDPPRREFITIVATHA